MNNCFAVEGMAIVSAMAFAPHFFPTSFQETSSARLASQSKVSRIIPRQNTTHGEVTIRIKFVILDFSQVPKLSL